MSVRAQGGLGAQKDGQGHWGGGKDVLGEVMPVHFSRKVGISGGKGKKSLN